MINIKHNGLFEKSEIKWFTVNELNRDIKMFRPHYIPIVNTIIYHEEMIKNSVINYNDVSHKRISSLMYVSLGANQKLIQQIATSSNSKILRQYFI